MRNNKIQSTKKLQISIIQNTSRPVLFDNYHFEFVCYLSFDVFDLNIR